MVSTSTPAERRSRIAWISSASVSPRPTISELLVKMCGGWRCLICRSTPSVFW